VIFRAKSWTCLSFLAFCFFLTVDADAVSEHVIYSFTGTADGMYPTALISDAAGNLYGANEFTANYAPGTVFELVKNGSTYTYVVLYTFTGNTDGGGASGSLALDSHGNLYGTTGTGGDNYKGSVFQLSPNQGGGWALTVLYSFSDSADGGYPYGGVVLDKAGNVYGATNEGGLLSDCSGAGCGVVFELSAGTGGNWTETVLHRFTETDGALPSSGLVFGANGVLYGTTSAGGTSTHCGGSPANGCGTVFQLAPSAGAWKETTLHSFDVTDGYMPQGVAYYHGRLFGTTLLGGIQNAGTVFELTPTKSGVTESVIHSFGSGTDATQPIGAVVFDKAGNLYGAASQGGNSACNNLGCGAIFELKLNSGNWTETILHQFTGGNDGASPHSTPFLSTTGLVGTASGGGASGYGVVFELTR
jgi:uncharacterized repeat protein (TIGR03803 family)